MCGQYFCQMLGSLIEISRNFIKKRCIVNKQNKQVNSIYISFFQSSKKILKFASTLIVCPLSLHLGPTIILDNTFIHLSGHQERSFIIYIKYLIFGQILGRIPPDTQNHTGVISQSNEEGDLVMSACKRSTNGPLTRPMKRSRPDKEIIIIRSRAS